MGQYYSVINVDKRVRLSPWDFDNGAKLMEFSYHGNFLINAVMNLLADQWKGDRVFFVGDYADLSDSDEPCHEALKALIEELGIAEDALYNYASENFENVSALADTEEKGWRYIYNHAEKQYIDIQHCPLEWAYRSADTSEPYVVTVAPISLLLAMGNGRGGGDFWEKCSGFEYVGSWCSTVRDIEITEEPLEVNYDEFCPNFTEREVLVPYTDEAEFIKREVS